MVGLSRRGRARVGSYTGYLIVTDGGGPTALQRKQIEAIPELRDVPVAVVTGSLAARGIVTALSWFGKSIKAFAPHQVPEALTYLGVPTAARPDACRAVAVLKAELMGESLDAIAGVTPVPVVDFVLRERAAAIKQRMRMATRR